MSTTDGTSKTSPQPLFPHILSVRYRVDVIMRTTAAQKAMVPVVQLQLHLSDGRVVQYEVTTAMLHTLRYNIAKALKDIHYLEMRRPPAAAAKKPKVAW